ncbi:MAG: type II toxin-antitoxin system RelE/ParE family toxin [Terriglobia bacterium]|jgi:phage-related protein
MAWPVEFYEDESGGRPVEKFLEALPAGHVGKVLQVLQMLEERGPHLPFPYSSQVEGKLRELRVHYGRTLYRILYYGDPQRTFVLLHAFEKRTQALPTEDVELARKRMTKDQEMKGR